MGLYNFQPRFVPYIMEGTKTHTIRAERKGPNDMPGDTMHLYTGLRHKGARLLMRVPCVRVEFVRITEEHRVLIGMRLDIDNPEDLGGVTCPGGFLELDETEKDLLAWRDGFRVGFQRRGAVVEKGCFRLMMQFWNGRLPFTGHIIHWRYQEPAGTFDGGIVHALHTGNRKVQTCRRCCRAMVVGQRHSPNQRAGGRGAAASASPGSRGETGPSTEPAGGVRSKPRRTKSKGDVKRWQTKWILAPRRAAPVRKHLRV